MEFVTDFVPVSYEDIYDSYIKRREYIAKIKNTHHRKIARNYYLHSLLEVGGRYKEILSPELTIEEPVYIFHHSGKVFDGHRAVKGFYATMAKTESNVIYSDDHRFAVAEWGFTLEQISHFYMTAEQFSKLTGQSRYDDGMVYVEHRPTMRAWPYDPQARMIGETLYYGHHATYSRLAPEYALAPQGVTDILAPLIAEAWSDYRENRAA